MKPVPVEREAPCIDSIDEMMNAIENGPVGRSLPLVKSSNVENKNDSFSSSSSPAASIDRRATQSIFCLAWAKICLQSDLPSMVETGGKADNLVDVIDVSQALPKAVVDDETERVDDVIDVSPNLSKVVMDDETERVDDKIDDSQSLPRKTVVDIETNFALDKCRSLLRFVEEVLARSFNIDDVEGTVDMSPTGADKIDGDDLVEGRSVSLKEYESIMKIVSQNYSRMSAFDDRAVEISGEDFYRRFCQP